MGIIPLKACFALLQPHLKTWGKSIELSSTENGDDTFSASSPRRRSWCCTPSYTFKVAEYCGLPSSPLHTCPVAVWRGPDWQTCHGKGGVSGDQTDEPSVCLKRWGLDQPTVRALRPSHFMALVAVTLHLGADNSVRLKVCTIFRTIQRENSILLFMVVLWGCIWFITL